MAINSRGSRKIIVDGVEFRWRATGTDFGISVCVWPRQKDSSRVHGHFDYQHACVPSPGGGFSLQHQLVVTNRLVRRVVLHFGVQTLLAGRTPIQAGSLDALVETQDALRSET